jgi:NADH-quinone oxidoreductase subunit D
MGPQHPSTHGVLRVILKLDGEKVLGTECVIGYLHRGVEKIAENRTYAQFNPYVDRMDYVAAVSNGLGYCLAVEKVLNVEAPPRAQAVRVILTELNRIASHLLWLGTHALDIGAITPVFYCLREREEALKIFEKYCGARLTTHAFRIGGLLYETYDGFEQEIRDFCAMFLPKVDEYEELLTNNRIWKGRLVDVGILSADECKEYGVTGPVLRAAGVKWDLRKAQPYSGYEKYEFDIPTRQNGDTYDRYMIRMEEMRQSVRIMHQCIERLRAPDGQGPVTVVDNKIVPPRRGEMKRSMEALIHHFKLYTEGFHVPPGEVYAAVEAPKGEFGVYLVADGTNKPYKCKIRAPGFAHLQAMDFICRGHMLADISAVLGSLDIVFGEVDR